MSHFLILHFIVQTEQQGLLCGKLSHRPDFSINFSLFFLSGLNSNCMRSNLMKNIPLSIFPSLDLMIYFFIGFHFFLQSQERYSKIYLLPLHNQIQFFGSPFSSRDVIAILIIFVINIIVFLEWYHCNWGWLLLWKVDPQEAWQSNICATAKSFLTNTAQNTEKVEKYKKYWKLQKQR